MGSSSGTAVNAVFVQCVYVHWRKQSSKWKGVFMLHNVVLSVSQTKRYSFSATSTCICAPSIPSVLDNVHSIWYRKYTFCKENKAHFDILFWVRLVHVRCNFFQRNRKQDRQYTYPAILRRVRVTIFVIKLQLFVLCIVELYVNVYNTKLLGAAQKCSMTNFCRRKQ
jgi:hypothetical protein